MRRDGIGDEAQALRAAVHALQRRYPTAGIPRELRARIVALVAQAKPGGWGVARVARTVGVSVASIRNWRLAPAGSVALVPVRVTGRRAAPIAMLRVVGPSGYRVEGLDISTTAALLRALE